MKHSKKIEKKPKFRLPFSAVLLYLLLVRVTGLEPARRGASS